MAQALSAFLSQAAKRGFAWGQHDCLLFAADWAREMCGQDPAAAWRGTYANEAEAEAILRDAGGIGMLVLRELAALGGWKAHPSPQVQDITLVRAPTRVGPAITASVCVGPDRFALVTARGLVVGPAPHVMLAWRYHG